MWANDTRFVALICGLALTVLGCSREISQVKITVVPNTGCAPLHVKLIGEAEVQEGISTDFSWTVGGDVTLQGPTVEYTFDNPGTYNIALTVAGKRQTKTSVATIQVREVELPRTTGIYFLQGCEYQAIEEVEEQKAVKELGRTTLADLEQKIVGRPLATAELVTHPLWRRNHTHTVYTVDRDQFVALPLAAVHSLGFLAVGENVTDVSLSSAPQAKNDPVNASKVVVRLIDSWDVDNMSPELHALRKEKAGDNAFRYLPNERLTEGLYVIDVKKKDQETPGSRPVSLIVSDN